MATKKTYSEKLRDPRWQKRRLKRLELSDWSCDVCCEPDSTLHVHHKAYFKGSEPWEYDDDQLAVLCERCHKEIHAGPDLLDEVISRLPLDGPNCRRDVGIVLTAIFFPKLTSDDDFSTRALKILSAEGGGADMQMVWDHIWFGVIHKMAKGVTDAGKES